MNMNKILDIAMEKDASDVHMIYGSKPMLRIARDLVEIEDMDVLKEEDMTEAYDYLVKGNVDKDEVYKLTKKLDISYEYKDIRIDEVSSLAVRYCAEHGDKKAFLRESITYRNHLRRATFDCVNLQ